MGKKDDDGKRNKMNAVKTGGFKSKLERYTHELFKENGIDLAYEKSTFELASRTSLKVVEFYKPHKVRGTRRTEMRKARGVVLPITYTPDFIVKGKRFVHVIECKGMAKPDYVIKMKMFLSMMDRSGHVVRVYEPHTERQVSMTLDLIKEDLK